MRLHDTAYIASAGGGFQQGIPDLPGKESSQSRCGAKVLLSAMNSTQTTSQSRKCHRGFESESVSHSVMSNPIDCSLPGFSVHGILQATVLEWVAMLFSMGSSQPRDQTEGSYISCVGRRVLYPLSHQGSPMESSGNYK